MHSSILWVDAHAAAIAHIRLGLLHRAPGSCRMHIEGCYAASSLCIRERLVLLCPATPTGRVALLLLLLLLLPRQGRCRLPCCWRRSPDCLPRLSLALMDHGN